MKITKIRFFEYGQKPPKNSRFKDTISNETVGGYFDYTSREEAKDVDKEIVKQEDGYFGYTGSHSVGTYSSSGELNTKEERDALKKEIDQCFHKDGNLCWDYVISLENDKEAYNLGLENTEQWLSAVKEFLPKMLKEYHIDYNNTLWWFDLHRNTEHPHIHLVFMEKHQTRTRGKLTPREMKNVKRHIYSSLSARAKLKERTGKDYRTFFQEKDMSLKELVTSIEKKDLKKNPKLKGLYKVLPKTGRLQYNSYNMKQYQPMIKSIIDDLIQSDDELNKTFNEYISKLDQLEEVMNEEGNDIATIKEAELEKFYSKVGNYILQNFKKTEYVEESKKDGNKVNLPYKPKKTYKKKYLTETKLKGYIHKLANEQQSEIDKAIEEYNRRMEEQLLV